MEFASVLLLSGTVTVAAEWPAFKTLDSDGDGRIDRVEYQKNRGKLNEYALNFAAMDDNNNGVDEDEWTAAAKTTAGYAARCQEASASWCRDAK